MPSRFKPTGPCRVVIATREFALTISLKTHYLAFRRAETKLPSSPAIEPWQVQTISRIQFESTMILNLSLKTAIYRSIWKTAVNVAEKHVGEQATDKKKHLDACERGLCAYSTAEGSGIVLRDCAVQTHSYR